MSTTIRASDGTELDAGVVNLSRAIRARESKGNYGAVGDAGTSKGAYQWQPGNFEAGAKQYGLDPSDFSPVNQDKVAYHQIKALKDKGYNPEQVAAAWNAGEGSIKNDAWKTKVGTTTINGQQIQYDTPGYVKAVVEEFQRAKGASGSQPNPSQGYNPKPFSQPTQHATPGQFDLTGLQSQEPAPQPEQAGGILGKLAQGAGNILTEAQKPFLGVAAIPTQLLAKAMGRPDPFAEGIPAGIPGMGQKADVTPLNLEKKAGDVAQVASYAIPGGTGLKAVAGGAGMGILQGAGASMSKGENLGQVASQGAIGGALGGGLAGATALLGSGLRGLGDTLSGAGYRKAVQGIKDAYSSALNLNAAERGFESRSGKDLAQVLLDHQAPLARHANGTLDASQAIPKLQGALTPLNQAADALVGSPQINSKVSNFIPLAKVEDDLIAKIRASSMDSLEKQKSITNARKLMKATIAEYGDVVSPQIGEKIKQGLQNSAFKKALTTSDSLQKNTTYLASNILRSSVEKAIGGQAGREYGLLNRQRGDLVDAITRLTKLDETRLLKGGRLGNMAGGMVGAISGASSGMGPFGALAGDYFGTRAAEFMNNPVTKIGAAKLKAKAAGALPGLFGSAGETVGTGVSRVGQGVSNSSRAVGLLGNLINR